VRVINAGAEVSDITGFVKVISLDSTCAVPSEQVENIFIVKTAATEHEKHPLVSISVAVEGQTTL